MKINGDQHCPMCPMKKIKGKTWQTNLQWSDQKL